MRGGELENCGALFVFQDFALPRDSRAEIFSRAIQMRYTTQNLAEWSRKLMVYAAAQECVSQYLLVLALLAPEPDVYLEFTFIFKMTLRLPRRRAKYGAPRPGGARWAAHRRAGRRASTAVRPTAGGAAPQESGRRSSRPRQAGATGTGRGRG